MREFNDLRCIEKCVRSILVIKKFFIVFKVIIYVGDMNVVELLDKVY